ncbi:MAG TPA: RT0821/Lpp0805 family surface protein [Stellaceae bacterium]|nr:RT0821/Lpp0805 family surface protein [Stellaceae bacterium]
MTTNLKISGAALGIAILASVAACVPDPYSQKDGHTTNTQVPQPYPADVYVPDQPAYAPPPQYVQAAPVQVPYDGISQSESVSVSRGTCDRGLLATPAATASRFAGAAAGPLVAGEIHAGMTPVDDSCVGLALEFAQNNQPVVWQNPGNGAQYQVTPISAYQQPNGPQCRQYTTVATSNGMIRTVNDTACRLPTGSWQLQG